MSPKKGTLVGFRERHSSFVADMQTCEVVPARISALLVPLRQLIASLSIRERLPQVELAIGDAVDVLVLRVLEPPDASDQDKLRQFAVQHRVQLFLQPKGPGLNPSLLSAGCAAVCNTGFLIST